MKIASLYYIVGAIYFLLRFNRIVKTIDKTVIEYEGRATKDEIEQFSAVTLALFHVIYVVFFPVLIIIEIVRKTRRFV